MLARSDAPAELGPRLHRSIAAPEFGALHFRRQLDALVRALQVRCLRSEGSEAEAELHARRHLTPGYDPEGDPEYETLIERVLASEPK